MSNKLTPAYIESLIEKADYQRYGETTTLCHLTLKGGFVVTGKSACINPANFDAEIGKQTAYKDAVNQIWELEGYHVKRSQAE